ncbi:MAG: hypothetical protein RJA44_144 [Pseudomonadota bacterium]|jgi:uncharacterized membrane protein
MDHVSTHPAAAPGSEPRIDAAPETAAEPITTANAPVVRLRQLRAADPLRWLVLGWHDYTRHPGIGSFFGLCFMVMGWLLLKVYEHAPAYTLAMSATFLLMGPFLCMGLYQVSMRMEQGEAPDFGDALTAWDTRTGQMAIFGFVLLILEMLWGRSAMVVFAVSFEGMPDFKGSMMALLDPENMGFIVAYCAVGAFFAALIFAISVVSIPMMLHRQVDAITAGLTSLHLAVTQPGVMAIWGGLIALLVLGAMLPWFFGLLVIGPVVGHASWHAYRAAVCGPEDADYTLDT